MVRMALKASIWPKRENSPHLLQENPNDRHATISSVRHNWPCNRDQRPAGRLGLGQDPRSVAAGVGVDEVSKRYGRNQRRRHREQISALTAANSAIMVAHTNAIHRAAAASAALGRARADALTEWMN